MSAFISQAEQLKLHKPIFQYAKRERKEKIFKEIFYLHRKQRVKWDSFRMADSFFDNLSKVGWKRKPSFYFLDQAIDHL